MMALEATQSRCTGLLVLEALGALAIFGGRAKRDAVRKIESVGMLVPEYKHSQQVSEFRLA